MKNKNITAQRVRELLNYDERSGVFTWKIAPNGRVCIGAPAGAKHKSKHGGPEYLRIGLDGRYYMAHVLAWLHYYGEMPCGIIDHVDGRQNSIENLRISTQAQNMANSKMNIRNKSGFKGVSKHGDLWQAKYSNQYGGLFSDPKDAARQYDRLATMKHGVFAMTNARLGLLA